MPYLSHFSFSQREGRGDYTNKKSLAVNNHRKVVAEDPHHPLANYDRESRLSNLDDNLINKKVSRNTGERDFDDVFAIVMHIAENVGPKPVLIRRPNTLGHIKTPISDQNRSQ